MSTLQFKPLFTSYIIHHDECYKITEISEKGCRCYDNILNCEKNKSMNPTVYIFWCLLLYKLNRKTNTKNMFYFQGKENNNLVLHYQGATINLEKSKPAENLLIFVQHKIFKETFGSSEQMDVVQYIEETHLTKK